MLSSDDDTEFKLCDFGLSAEVNCPLSNICGSPGYVAPEILRKTPYDTKVDMFSLGVIAYIL